jgi:hypothetical protein
MGSLVCRRSTQPGERQSALAQQVPAPFGLHWTRDKNIAKVFDRAGAHIVEKAVIDGRKAWTVECLIQPALKRTIVYFGREKNLVEVALHINSPIGIS